MDCINCVNCTFVRGFMCTCHVSYTEEREDGTRWHVQLWQDVSRKHANKCDHYSTEQYDCDKFFVI